MRLIEVYIKLYNIKLPKFSPQSNLNYIPDMMWSDIIKNYKNLRTLEKVINLSFSKSPNLNSYISQIPNNSTDKSPINSTIKSETENLQQQINILLNLLEPLCSSTPQTENTVNIKLQDNIGTFKNFYEIIENFDTIFQSTSIINYKIVSLDKGSNYIQIAIDNAQELAFFMAIVYGTIKIRKSYYEGSYYKELTEKTKLETTIQTAKEYKNNKNIDHSKKEICRTLNINYDFEEIINNIIEKNEEHIKNINGAHKAIENAMLTFMKLMEDNIEIHKSLNPPTWLKENKEGLETIDYESIKKIEKPQKQIEHKEKE